MHRRVTRLVAATASAVLAAGPALLATPQVAARADAPKLSIAHVWNAFPADTGTNGVVVPDSRARTAVAFSDTAVFGPELTRAQAISLDTGHPLSRLASVPALRVKQHAPIWVDERRGLLIYAAPVSSTPASGSMLVGIRMSGKPGTIAFHVPLRFGTRTVLAITPDTTGNDVFVAASNDEALNGEQLTGASGTGVEVDRVALDPLLHGALQPRWTSPYDVPLSVCPALIATQNAVQMLALGSSLFLPCRQAQPPALGGNGPSSNVPLPGVLSLNLSATGPTGSPQFYPAPGNYAATGESVADAVDGRLVLIDSSYGFGARVFDARHGRYVGRVPVGGRQPSGYVVDPSTGRLYVGTPDGSVGLAFTDLRALVPTQGLRLPDPWAQFFGQRANLDLWIGFDTVRDDLLLPLQTDDPHHPFQLFVIHDGIPAYSTPTATDPDAGALNADERPGVTYSQREASAQAYGADYQVIGGRANLRQNVAGDAGTSASPGSNFLRQAEVGQATLSNDESTANAVLGREDHVTDSDRSGVPGAGSTFAPIVSCNDFGTSPQSAPKVADAAYVSCDLTGTKTTAGASFVGDSGVMMTAGNTPPAAAPVQVSRSSVSVTEQRQPNLGPVTMSVTATADGIQLPGAVRIGSVSSTLTLSAHGRPGTAIAKRVVTVEDVVIAGSVLCRDDCSLNQVESVLNAIAPGRVHVDFPATQTTTSPHGTYAEIVQDPWFHAERVLDADKADTDLAVPAMSITITMDGKTKSRLVVDLAGAAASNAYRVYAADKTAPGVSGPSVAPKVVVPAPLGPLTGASSTATPAVAAQATPATGLIPSLGRAAHFVISSLGRLASLLPVFVLLGVPVYLSARRRLLLELPLLTRDEESK